MMKKIIIWALFDSGNGCYKQAVDEYFSNEIEIYSIGIDIENKNSHFLHLNLADYSVLFGENKLFKVLDTLPKPDILLASPPCESWSVASAIKDGNICWTTERIHTLWGEHLSHNHFSLRTKQSFDKAMSAKEGFQANWDRSVFNRINGELCAINTIRIIKRYSPYIWMIENPQSSRLWRYYKQIQDFKGIHNVVHYHVYNENFAKKPTIFFSNIYLELKTSAESSNVVISCKKNDSRKTIRSYNERSNIPLELIQEILQLA